MRRRETERRRRSGEANGLKFRGTSSADAGDTSVIVVVVVVATTT